MLKHISYQISILVLLIYFSDDIYKKEKIKLCRFKN